MTTSSESSRGNRSSSRATPRASSTASTTSAHTAGRKFLDDEPSSGNVRKAFVCPYHSWTYDLNGCLIGTPNVREDEHFDRGQYPLHGFPVDTYAGFLS